MRSAWIRVGPKSSGKSPYKRREKGREQSHVKMEAEIGVTQLQAKKCLSRQKLEETGRIVP